MSFLSTIFGEKTTQNNSIKTLSSMDFKSLIEKKNILLVDVRTSREYKSDHLKGAINIDFFSGNFKTEFNKLDKKKTVYVYCRSGSRSRQASKKLINMGFEDICDLKGGIINY